MQPCLFQAAAHIPTAVGAGDAVKRSVASPWQHQKWKMLDSGLFSDSQSLSLQLPISPRRRRWSCAEPFLPAQGEELGALC